MINYKFREDELIAEFQRYIDSTYNQHYSKNKFQSTEIIIERGHGTGFCMGNVDKYSNRYGNKGTRDDARKDLMKILHYALIQLYVHDRETSQLENSLYDYSSVDEDLGTLTISDISLADIDLSINGDDTVSLDASDNVFETITISGVNDEH